MFSGSFLVLEFTCVHLISAAGRILTTSPARWLVARSWWLIGNVGKQTDGNVSGKTNSGFAVTNKISIAGKTEHGIGMNASCRLATLPTPKYVIPDAGKTNQH